MARFGSLGTQYFDNAGDPLIDGKIFFFISGTDTPKDTFADVNETIANPNPVILSGSGRQPNIFFSGSARAILSESDDTSVEERDPVGAQATSDAFSEYNALIVYQFNEIVTTSDGKYFASITNNNVNNDPLTTTGFWMEIRFINVWDTAYNYQSGAVALDSDNNLYLSLINNNLGNQPLASPTEWKQISASINNGSVTGQLTIWNESNLAWESTDAVTVGTDGNLILLNAVEENVYDLQLETVLDPNNGTMQHVAITVTITFTDLVADGESMTLYVGAGASQTITWPAAWEWTGSGGNVAPTLGTKDTITIWNLNAQVYAAWVGSSA